MYKEFRQLALDDLSSQESSVGVKHLVQFYDAALASQKVISDEIAQDLLSLVRSEMSSEDRPAFQKLRAAWRNGAFNMKNRKKIDNMLDQDLKAELEK